jgi:DNA-binding GntR family transcriptional regulator
VTATDKLGFHPAGRRRSLVDDVADALRAQIISCEYPPGRKISVREVSASHDVSAIPVREAMRILETDGLLSGANRGSRIVRPVSRSELDATYSLRLNVEPSLIPTALANLTDKRVASLRDAADAIDEYAGDVRRGADAWRAHRAFHHDFLLHGQEQVATQLVTLLWDHSDRYTHLAYATEADTPITDSVPRLSTKPHSGLLTTALEGTEADVVAEWTTHLQRSWNRIQEAVARLVPPLA